MLLRLIHASTVNWVEFDIFWSVLRNSLLPFNCRKKILPDENFPTDFTATGQDNPPDEFLTKLPASPTGPDNPSDEPHSSSDNTPDGKSSDSNESDYEPVESSFDQGDEGEELCFCNIGHPPGPHCNRGNSRTVPFTIVTRMVDQFNTERDLRSNEKNLPSKRNLSDLPQPEAKKQRTEPKL